VKKHALFRFQIRDAGPSRCGTEAYAYTAGGDGEISCRGGWTPPDVSIQELMALEPTAMFYNHTVPDIVASEWKYDH
jgi:hypothetical protein